MPSSFKGSRPSACTGPPWSFKTPLVPASAGSSLSSKPPSCAGTGRTPAAGSQRNTPAAAAPAHNRYASRLRLIIELKSCVEPAEQQRPRLQVPMQLFELHIAKTRRLRTALPHAAANAGENHRAAEARRRPFIDPGGGDGGDEEHAVQHHAEHRIKQCPFHEPSRLSVMRAFTRPPCSRRSMARAGGAQALRLGGGLRHPRLEFALRLNRLFEPRDAADERLPQRDISEPERRHDGGQQHHGPLPRRARGEPRLHDALLLICIWASTRSLRAVAD